MLCLASAHAQTPPKLPEWFWNPPNLADVQLASGYSRPYYYPQSSYSEAFEDAALRLWQDRECSIRAAMGSLTQGSKKLSMGGIADINSDTIGFAAFKRKLVHLDSCWSDELVLMLVGTRSVRLNGALVPSPVKQSSLKPVDETVLGKSTSEIYYYVTSSWKEAELYARRNLAIAADSHLRSLTKIQNQNLYKVISIESSVHFHNITTVKRFVDSSTGGCVVYVSAMKKNIELID